MCVCVGLGCLFREVSVKDIMMMWLMMSAIFMEKMMSLLVPIPCIPEHTRFLRLWRWTRDLSWQLTNFHPLWHNFLNSSEYKLLHLCWEHSVVSPGMLLPMSPYWEPRLGVLEVSWQAVCPCFSSWKQGLGIGKGKGMVKYRLIFSVLVYKSIRK